MITHLERRHDRLVLADRARHALGRRHVQALVPHERLPHEVEHLPQARVLASGREAAVELVVGRCGRCGVAGGVEQPPVGGPQGSDRLRTERRRLPNRDGFEDQQGRDELAQLGGIEQVGLPQVIGDRLDVRIGRRSHAGG